MAAKKKAAPKTSTATVKKTRVLLVDDFPVVREGLVRVIEQEPDLVVCGQAENIAQALQVVETSRPDIAIVDISLQGLNGIELMKDLRVRYPRLPLLVLSMHDESVYAGRCLQAGARGYIMKQEPPEKLLQAIRRVMAGEVYLSDPMTRQMLNKVAGMQRADGISTPERLSDREFEVFEFIGQGHRPHAIAQKMHLSVKTIEYHCENIKRKLKLNSAAELLQYAVQWMQHENPR